MKEKLSKVIKICMAGIMALMLSTQSVTEIFAKTVIMDRETSMSSYISVKEFNDNIGGYHPEGGKRVFKIDGKYAYCIESDIGISEDRVYQDGNNAEEILKNGRQNILTDWQSKYDMISALLTMIPSQIDSDTKAEHIKWLAGQTMIWEITGEERDWGFVYVGPTRSGASSYRNSYIWNYVSDKEAFDSFYKEIENKMSKYWGIPSFTRNKISASKIYDLDKYDGTYYYTTLTDTRGVLENFEFSASGLTFEKSGNQLTVKTKTPITDTITIQTKPSSALKMRSPVFWTDGSAQKTVTCGDVEDPSPFAYFKVKLGLGDLNVIKQDDYKMPIAGAIFDITSPDGKVKSYTTDANGKISIVGVIPGQYIVKEKSAPNGFLLNTQAYTVNVTAGNTASVTIYDDEPTGKISITKKSEYNENVAGAKFKIVADGNIVSANNKLLYASGTIVDTVVSGSNGVAITKQLPLGNYKVIETEVPYGYLLNTSEFKVLLKYANQTTALVSTNTTVVNKQPTGKINITKTSDNKDKVAGAKFNIIADGNVTSVNGKVLYTSGTIVDTVTSGVNGIATTKNLPLGNYKVAEIEVPLGYLLNTNQFKVSLKYANQNTSIVFADTTVVNKEPLGQIELKKEIDSSVTDGQEGDVFLSSIEYGLYAKEDIKNVAGSKVYYTKDQLVSSKQINQEGLVIWDNLPMGKYYLKELKTNNSLLINNNPIDVILSYKDMNTAYIKVKAKTSDIIASQHIQIFKEGIKDGEAGVVSGLKGAEFTFVLNSDYEKVGYEKAKKYFVGTTDGNGYLTTSRLPYGVYRVKETKTPDGYYGTSDFLVSIEKDSSLYEIGYKIKKVTVNNVPFESLLKIVKKDSESNKVILKEGASFKVKNLDTNEYISYIDWSCFPNIVVDQWSTHKDGSITLNTKLKKGHYQLEEIKAPNGYLISKEPLLFEINDQTYDISSDGKTPITTVEFKDEAVTGKIRLEKRGEILEDYKDGKFVYKLNGLKGAKFGVYAKEDILCPTNDQSVLYKKGMLVCTLITDEEGKAISEKLPLGEYECIEIETPYGYVLNEEVKTFSLSYKDEVTDIVYQDIEVINDRQKVKVNVSKKDQDTLKYLDNAELSLIANKDIYNHLGKKIVSEGTVIETIRSSFLGSVCFNTDLPIDMHKELSTNLIDEDITVIGNKDAMFLVKETKQPDGYLSKKVHYYVDTSYTHQKEHTLIYEYDFLNKQTQSEIHKIDAETLMQLEGAKLQVIDTVTNNVIDEWISDGTGHKINGLVVDRNYILREVSAPVGYQISPDIEFNIRDIDEVQHISIMNTKVQVLGDEPVITEDYTIFYTYILMILGASIIIFILRRKED